MHLCGALHFCALGLRCCLKARANDRCWSYSTVASEKTTIVGGTSALGWWSTGKVWQAAVGGGGMGEGSCSCKCLSPPRGGGGGACRGVQKSDTCNPLCDISFICDFFTGPWTWPGTPPFLFLHRRRVVVVKTLRIRTGLTTAQPPDRRCGTHAAPPPPPQPPESGESAGYCRHNLSSVER